MAHDYRDKYTVCPFYQKEFSTRIICEGLMDESSCSTTFANHEAKDKHKRALCEKEFTKCPLCDALYKKYN